MATGIIDLDLTPPGQQREPRAAWRLFTVPRSVLVAAVVLLLLLTLGAASPPRRGITHLLSAGGQPAAAFVLADDALFTASFGNNPNSESAVRRWSLPDGRLAWALSLPQNVQNLVYDESSGVLMGRSATEPRVSFLDGGTGAVLWRDESPNTVVMSIASGHVLMLTDLEQQRATLRLLDARTGRLQWSRVVDDAYLGTDDLSDALPTRVVAADAAGHAQVLDVADGSVLARGELRVKLGAQYDNSPGADYVGISTFGDALYISRRDKGAATLTAFELDTLKLSWQATAAAAGGVLDCGRVLCVGDSEGVAAVDPHDGRTLWRRSGLGLAYPYDGHTLLGYEGSDVPQALLLDPATGAVRQRLGNVVVLTGVLLRADQVKLGRTWVEVTGEDGALHVVGVLETAAPFGCELHGPYLACPTSAGPTQVWRIPLHLT